MSDDERIVVVQTASPTQVLRALLERLEAGHRGVLATVTSCQGSTPSSPGQKMALLGPDDALGSVGGGAIELKVLQAMGKMLSDASSRPATARYELGAKLGMCCGGVVEVLIEPLEPAAEVLLAGAGHIGLSLAPLLVGLGFRVVLCDSREQTLEAAGLEESPLLCVICGEHDDPELLAALGRCERAAAVVMSYDHQLDQVMVEWALRCGFSFVGGVGSRAKAARTRDRLDARGFSAEDVARVRIPVGVAIGARTAPEIAVSIAGELVQWRARRRERGVDSKPAVEATARGVAVLSGSTPDGASGS